MSITSASADLNILSNPQIYKDLNTNNVTIAKNAVGIVIVITLNEAQNISNSTTASAAAITALSARGFFVTFNPTTITIESNTSPLPVGVLTNYTFVIKDNANATIYSEIIGIEILNPTFTNTQESCEYCLLLNPTESATTSQLPTIANRGKIDYIFIDALGVQETKASGNYNDIVEACWCGSATNLAIRSVLTIRQIPHCGGTSPIVFQAIDNTTVNITEYVPDATYSAIFACCIVKDKAFGVTPLSFSFNNSAPHDSCDYNSLKYNLLDVFGNEIVLTTDRVGTITTDTTDQVVGIGTTFSDYFIGTKFYSSTNVYLGTILSIESNTALTLVSPSSNIYAGAFKTNTFYFKDPSTTSIFSYTPSTLGTYTLTATLNNCCDEFVKEWKINVCKSYIVETGTCNNSIIKNISSINFLKITLTTNDEESLLDSNNTVIFDDVIIAPLSELTLDGISDGFYLLTIEEMEPDSSIINTETQVIFYDCNIKACEVALTQKVMCFDFNCDNDYDYSKIMSERMKFEMLKVQLYSYWNDIKVEQSVPSSWDIEDHLQELSTYSETLKKIESLCTSCGLLDSNDCFKGTISSVKKSSDCGCNK